MENSKRNNDPWLPLDEDLTKLQYLAINPMPNNPLHQMIDSEKYIQSLEQKLKKLSKARLGEPTSREIISSLALFHDDQMRRYVEDPNINSLTSAPDMSDEHLTPLAFMHRKLHPEKQPLNAEEILELVKEDILGKTFEASLEKRNGDSSCLVSSSSARQLKSVSEADAESSKAVLNSNSSTLEQQISTPSDHILPVISNSHTATDENWAVFENMNSEREETS